MHLRTQQRGSVEKPGLRDVKRADFMRNWRRSGLQNPDKPNIFYSEKLLKCFVPPVLSSFGEDPD